jgi:hypothetical protein
MKRLGIIALFKVMLSATVGLAGYAVAGCCDPGSGCCGTNQNQTYVGKPLFGASVMPSQTTATANVPVKGKKIRAAQPKSAQPVAPWTQQAAMQLPGVLSFSRTPCLGTLW